jgi:hypothetical protein
MPFYVCNRFGSIPELASSGGGAPALGAAIGIKKGNGQLSSWLMCLTVPILLKFNESDRVSFVSHLVQALPALTYNCLIAIHHLTLE